jgi:hypothetical protein
LIIFSRYADGAEAGRVGKASPCPRGTISVQSNPVGNKTCPPYQIKLKRSASHSRGCVTRSIPVCRNLD